MRQETDPGMLPQSQALEPRSADKPSGGHETGLRGHNKASGVQQGREERSRSAAVTPIRGVRGVQRVFVLDQRGNPLMPCHPARARELLGKGRALAVKFSPFTIRLKDRIGGVVQPVRLGVDPGSKTTGMALSRDTGEAREVLFKLEIMHRSELIHKRMQQRAAYRRRRRSSNLRYRQPRFMNRTKPEGWLAPSLRSRVQHTESWARRLQRSCPVSVVDLELVRFDTQKMQNPEISRNEYQHGTLYGFEVREYLLAKFRHQCVYCDARNVPLNLDHVIARSRGGSDRVSNLVLSCVSCNQRKGSRLVAEFSPDHALRIIAQAKRPLRDAAAVNSTRFATLAALRGTGLAVECSSGGRTKWNRVRFGVPKGHALDAACVGDLSGLLRWDGPCLSVKAMGRGSHKRTTSDANGFPRLYFTRIKQVHGFTTGDLVSADVPRGKHIGRHVGRVAVRSSGYFLVGVRDGISYKYYTLMQRADGYEHIR